MTAQEILDAIRPLNEPVNEARRFRWLTGLGYQMTVSARSGYPAAGNKIEHLVAFNELQHRLYNYIRACQRKDEWNTVQDFLEGLRNYSVELGVAGDFGWAVHTSIQSLTQE
jgi:hypothetical protein